MNLAFLASNSGSSFRGIVEAIERGALAARPCLLVVNRPAAPALEYARQHGVASRVIPTLPDPAAADAALCEALRGCAPDLVILSGYLRRLGTQVLAAFEGRILNIHPALLPAFGGEGMYGRRVHEAVLASGVGESGATVHLVDEIYDHGPAIAQARVPVLPDDTVEQLQARVMAAEPPLFIATLQAIERGEILLPALRGST